MRFFYVLLLMSASVVSNANVAVDNINEIINKTEKTESVQNIFKEYEFIYIFKSTCPHCKNFTPIIHNFTETYHVPITGYSVDGGKADGIKSKLIEPEVFNALFNEASYKPVVPALFLLNKHTNQAYAVTFGEASAVDLASRLSELLKKIKENYDA